MYKYLLCSRYLRTRWIALASIISVTLGVATMIVVNSVMAGFRHEMYERLHGILSDVTLESHTMEGFANVDWHMEEVKAALGDDLEAASATVTVPAMLSFQYQGQWVTRPLQLIGVDEATYAEVGDFGQHLLHPANRKQLGFNLHEEGYPERLPMAGWPYRRERVKWERAVREQMEEMHRFDAVSSGPIDPFNAARLGAVPNSPEADLPEEPDAPGPRPSTRPPGMDAVAENQAASLQQEAFDDLNNQQIGIILGISTVSMKKRLESGEAQDIFLALPGDDVKVTFPTTGTPPRAVSGQFTVVDFFESKMSEYDATFAFVPLKDLQRMRGMIDPQSGVGAVTSIQIKLKEGADLNQCRDRLAAQFPTSQFPYRIQTWMDMQGPLLSAVQLETTILNILLFLIITVAGFGILATFFMIVVEKTKDIGVLKSLGAPASGIAKIFLTYGLSLGMVGSGAGMVLGLLFVVYINEIAKLIEYFTGREVFDPTVYYFQQIPTIINPLTVAWIVAGAVLIAVMASVLPAMRAARMHPVEALRYE